MKFFHASGLLRSCRATRARMIAAAMVFGFSATSAFGGFASSVVDYTPGTGGPSGYDDPAAALGPPAPVVGAGTIYPNVLDPFSPAFGKPEIVVIGTGGQLTLQLDTPITVANTPQLGVISNVGLIDSDYPNGTVSAPASIFGGGSAEVRVSGDGNQWVSLGIINFNLPASFYSKLSSPYEMAPGPGDTPADLGKPFTGTLSDFSGESFQQVMNTLGGSVGGTWLNLDGTDLTSVDYVQFRNPSGDSGQLAIDAITTANTPEPGSAMICLLVISGAALRRRGRATEHPRRASA